MNDVKKIGGNLTTVLYKTAGVLILLLSFAGGWYILDFRAFLNTPLTVEEGGSHYIVAPGTSLSRLAHGLAARGITDTPAYLVLLGRWQRVSQHIKAGEYHIEPGTTPSMLLTMLVQGRVRLYPFTIVEGWTFRQMLERMRESEDLVHTLQGLDDATIMQRLGHAGEHPEGRFFPETYRFPGGTRDIDFLRRAYQLMEQHLQREWQGRADGLPLKTPYEALILASIVEKETALATERGAIAGVFIRRLKRNMRLQTDPTVIYGMGERYDGNIRRKDLRADTPYNTYTRAGLPPTPIALPGGDSIHAVLHPDDGEALYFVSRGDGSHYFSETLEQHNQAVIKYQLGGKNSTFSSSPQ